MQLILTLDRKYIFEKIKNKYINRAISVFLETKTINDLDSKIDDCFTYINDNLFSNINYFKKSINCETDQILYKYHLKSNKV